MSSETKSEPKAFFSAKDCDGVSDVEYAEVAVWGKVLRIRSLTGDDLVRSRETAEGDAKKTADLRLIIASVVNADDAVVFTMNDLGWLRKRSAKSLNTITNAIAKLNAFEVDVKNA